MRRGLMLVPLALFLLVVVFLYRGLYLNPAELPSAMIGKPFPEFSLPSVQGDKTLTRAGLFWLHHAAKITLAHCVGKNSSYKSFNISSMCSRELDKRGTLCCPPSLPFWLSHR